MSIKAIGEKIADQISQIDGVTGATLDDFNVYGDCQVVVSYGIQPNRGFAPKGLSLANVTAKVKSILKDSNFVSEYGITIEHPRRQYDRSYGQCAFSGYDRSYTMIDFTLVNTK